MKKYIVLVFLCLLGVVSAQKVIISPIVPGEGTGSGLSSLPILTNGIAIGSATSIDYVAGVTGFLDGAVVKLGTTGGGGTPAGSTFRIQYNSNNAFAADVSLWYNVLTNELIISNSLAGGAMLTLKGAGTRLFTFKVEDGSNRISTLSPILLDFITLGAYRINSNSFTPPQDISTILGSDAFRWQAGFFRTNDTTNLVVRGGTLGAGKVLTDVSGTGAATWTAVTPPNVQIVSPGANVATLLAAATNNSTFQFGNGTYTITPSQVSSNQAAGNTYTGVFLSNKTNVTLLGIPGQTIWDGTSQLGELFFVSNCSNIRISGITFRGYTNWIAAQLPLSLNTWSGILYCKVDNFTFENNIVERHADHGIADAGWGQILAQPASTNNVRIRNNYFTDIGGWRTNTGGAGLFGIDGTAITPTGGIIEGNYIYHCLRGIEPYTDANGHNKPFSVIIRNNNLHNCVDTGIGNFGTTNMVDSFIEGNNLLNDGVVNYHGTNYGGTVNWAGVGISLTGGRNITIRNNTVSGSWDTGFLVYNSGTFKCDDFAVTDNRALNINASGQTGYGYWFGDRTDSAAAASSIRRAYIARNYAANTLFSGFSLFTGRDVEFVDNVAVNCSALGANQPLASCFLFGYTSFTSGLLTNVTVRGNVAYLEDTLPTFGFYIENNVSSMLFENNRIVTNATSVGAILNEGITNRSGANVTVIGPARQFYTTIDIPSIGANAQYTTNFAATGVTTNDVVENLRLPTLFYTSGNTTNVAVNSWCSNATVFVRILNNAPAAADPGSVRMVATVRQVQIRGQ